MKKNNIYTYQSVVALLRLVKTKTWPISKALEPSNQKPQNKPALPEEWQFLVNFFLIGNIALKNDILIQLFKHRD